MQLLHCDKPYNLDEAAARRGTPRRKRKDSRTTAYELTIRIPEEHRRHFGGKKKLTRVVFALNKKVDLKGQVRAFEEEKNAILDLALEARGGGSLDSAAWAAMPFGEYAERYVERRAGVISPASTANERRYLKYAKATIGSIPLKELVAEDVERCVLAVPRLSEEWALEKRRREEENRERLRQEGRLKRRAPFSPVRVAGPAMQSKVLKFVREVLGDAVDREHVGRNVAKKRFLSKSFKKGRPLIDPLMEDEAARFLEEAAALPLCMAKVAVLVLFATGMRPEELLALRVGSFVDAQDGGEAQIRIVAALREGRIEGYTSPTAPCAPSPSTATPPRSCASGWRPSAPSSTGWASSSGAPRRSWGSRAGCCRTRASATRGAGSSSGRGSRGRAPTRCATRSPPSTWRAGRTSRPSRCCSGAPTPPTRSTCTWGSSLQWRRGSRAATWAGSRRVSLLGRLARRGLLEAGRIFDDGRAACCILSLA